MIVTISLLICLPVFEMNVIAETIHNENREDPDSVNGFKYGDGTKMHPFEITTAEELSYMSCVINYKGNELINGTLTYATAYYKLMNHISLNDERFQFIPQSGLIQVADTDGSVIYLGTGIKAEDSENEFYQTASQKGTSYQ